MGQRVRFEDGNEAFGSNRPTGPPNADQLVPLKSKTRTAEELISGREARSAGKRTEETVNYIFY